MTEKRQKRFEITREQVLDVFGFELKAKCLRTEELHDCWLQWWTIDGTVVIVQQWKSAGWDYYLPGREGSVDKIAADIRKYADE